MYTLPVPAAGRKIEYPHFPNRLCCFVFRNWEIIDPKTMAEVVGAGEDEILSLAVKMGLPMPPSVNPDWLRFGYITVIRSNWHLLSYRQICALLGWDEERLAFTLKEDDFLDVKLGAKSDIDDLVYAPLTAAEERELEAVRKAAQTFYLSAPAVSAEPFAFCEMFRKARDGYEKVNAGGLSKKTRFADRVAYSYCALYGDTFIENTEASFPDELLEAYRACGVNGIWCQAVLYKLTPFPFEPSFSEGYEKRLEGVRALTERLDRYGIKLYLYLNEPRAMPLSFFEAHPGLRGVTGGAWATLCTSLPEVKEYLYNGAALIVKNAPLLGGFFTITASENLTSCYSHRADGGCECPRCGKRPRAEVIAEINSLIYGGAASVKPDIKLIAWSWGWEPHITPQITELLPKGAAVMGVSEQGVEKNIGGIKTSVIDYSISVVGPGEYAKKTWEHAKETGHPAYAKCQFNNTWECSFVPFLPAFEQIYKHIAGLCEAGVDGLFLDWTLGGFPSPTFKMIKPMFYESERLPSLDELYRSVFPAEAAGAVKAACHEFSVAFDAFPFHIGVAYVAPQNSGTANLLYIRPTGFGATMVGFPYDDIGGWRAIYPEDVFENQFKILSEGWEKGLALLEKIDKKVIGDSYELSMLRDCAEAAYCHFRSSYLQIKFVRVRDKRREGSLAVIAEEEAALALRLAAVCARNPAIGYESSNHYFYTRAALAEKYVNCRHIIDNSK